MKVILLQEVKGQGGEGDVVEAARGYAVNYLFPKNLAIEATKGNLKQLESRRHNIEKRETQRLDSADKLFAALNESTIVVSARVGEEGQLFGSVTTTALAAAIAEQTGADVDKKRIDISAPIKTAGEHSATISIYREVKAAITVKVVDEKAAAEDKSAEVATEASEATESESAELLSASDAEEFVGEANAEASADVSEDALAEVSAIAE